MSLKLRTVREYLRSSLWVIPALGIAGAIGLAKLLLFIDHAISQKQNSFFLFGGGASSARTVLSTIASSMITFTGVVFSITMLVLQLASSQLSPRVMRTFLRDRFNQVVLGVFVMTLTYALFVLREIHSPNVFGGFVPALSIWVAFVLVLTSIGLFVAYINHIAQSIRASTVIGKVGDETRSVLDALYPERLGNEPDPAAALPDCPPDLVIAARGPSGVVTRVDDRRLMTWACEANCLVALLPMPGDFVPEGGELFHIWGDASGARTQDLAATVSRGRVRSMDQDAAFGFRQLVDIAERALSPGINDPTTAVQALDQIHDLLRRLVGREFPSALRLGDEGAPRLFLPHPEWDGYVMLALDEIRQYGQSSLQIARRLRYLLEDLLGIAPESRQAAIKRQLALLDASIRRGFPSASDQVIAREGSAQGHGP